LKQHSQAKAQCEKILNYINIGKEEGAVVLAGGEAGNYEGRFQVDMNQTNSIKEQTICVYSKKKFWAGCSLNNI
jgi:hypothetical protein